MGRGLMAVTKRIRFEVLRRDDHTCRYCGHRAPDVTLTVDHVTPKALGGSDDPANLVAACKDCNMGKSSVSPDGLLVTQVAEDEVRWAQAIRQAACAAVDDVAATERYADLLDAEWARWGIGPSRTPIPRPAGWYASVARFYATGLPVEVLVDSARLAIGTDIVPPEGTWKYFCGIAWNRLREIQETAKRQVGDPDPATDDEESMVRGEEWLEGYSVGYDDGCRVAEKLGYDTGFAAGREDGYRAGQEAMYEQGWRTDWRPEG